MGHIILLLHYTGPSVLDVFRTLVKHLRLSIQGPVGSQDEVQMSFDDSAKFQKSITKTVGEFAGALPDYHKPDIMSLINSYVQTTGYSAGNDSREEPTVQWLFRYLLGAISVNTVSVGTS